MECYNRRRVAYPWRSVVHYSVSSERGSRRNAVSPMKVAQNKSECVSVSESVSTSSPVVV